MSSDFDFDALMPPEYRIPPIPKEWWIVRRYWHAVRLTLLVRLMCKYHIFPGPEYWQANPLSVWWSIRQAIKHAEPFEFPEDDLPA